MIRTKQTLIFALLFPIIILFAITLYNKYILSYGDEIMLPVSGYDPRDLLSGHYLVYQINYGVTGICDGNNGNKNSYVCLEPKLFSYLPPKGCKKLIRGICNNRQFKAGIERYYIPEDKAKALDDKIRKNTASIVITITSSGKAQVKDLLFNGKSWRNQ